MRRAHRGAPLYKIKDQLEQDFGLWCKENEAEETTRNMIEFLIQKNFIQGKEFLEYCDNIKLEFFTGMVGCMEPMQEGFIPPKAWIGYRKGRKKNDG